MENKKFGTKEWAEVNKNIYVGCEHNCRYCYARYNALTRLKKIQSPKEWTRPLLDIKKFAEKPKKVKGRIMFPTQHDITPENLENCLDYLKRWLQVGNEILIVSKPHLECIKRLCQELEQYRDQILFRFTIGSWSDDVLDFWEPDAPRYDERRDSLIYAFNAGFRTSVSCEPLLDESAHQYTDVKDEKDNSMVLELLPHITDTIWIGKMNFIKPRVNMAGWTDKEFQYLDKVNIVCSDNYVWSIYSRFKNTPKVKWKESVKKVIGLPDEGGVA